MTKKMTNAEKMEKWESMVKADYSAREFDLPYGFITYGDITQLQEHKTEKKVVIKSFKMGFRFPKSNAKSVAAFNKYQSYLTDFDLSPKNIPFKDGSAIIKPEGETPVEYKNNYYLNIAIPEKQFDYASKTFKDIPFLNIDKSPLESLEDISEAFKPGAKVKIKLGCRYYDNDGKDGIVLYFNGMRLVEKAKPKTSLAGEDDEADETDFDN
jgi:hypothetical protein